MRFWRTTQIGGSAAWLLGFVLFLPSLLLGVYLTFPTAALQQRLIAEIERQAPVKISLDKLTLQPLLTLKGDSAEMTFTDLPGYRLPIDAFRVSPWWSSLLSTDPGVAGLVQALGGELQVLARKSGQLSMTVSGAALDLPLATTPALGLAANLSKVLVETTVPLRQATPSRVTLDAEQVEIKGLAFLTGDAAGLPLGRVQLEATGTGPSFKLERCAATGGALEVTAAGTLLLATNLPSSRINLILTIKPGTLAKPALTGLLELSGPKQADGSYRLRLTGTLANPLLKPER